MTAELCGALHDELDRVAADRSSAPSSSPARAAAFCAGLDLSGYGDSPGNDGTDAARDRLGNQEHMSRLILKLRATPQPVIAAVNGPAAGFGLALALGERHPLRRARGGLPRGLPQHRRVELRHGHELAAAAPGRRVARARAAAHRPAGARRGGRADRAGRRVVDDEALLDHALEAAEQIAAWSPWGVRLTKQGMWSALEIPSELAAIEYEDRQQIMALHGVAPAEAITAFLEKRPARVRGLMSWSDEAERSSTGI